MINILNNCLGKSLKLVGGNQIHLSQGKIFNLHYNFALHFEEVRLIITLNKPNSFCESEDGHVFYSYKIYEDNKNKVDDNFDASTIEFTSESIVSIDCYERNPKKYQFEQTVLESGFLNQVNSMDMFQFNGAKGKFLLCYDPYMPQIQLLFGNKEIDDFFVEYGGLYTLEKTIQ